MLPYMWNKKGAGYVGNFLSNKLMQLENTGVVHPTGFYLGNLVGMFEYFKKTYTNFECLHVYIAAYSEEDSDMVPLEQGNKLTLIFAPASEGKDLDYFNLRPGEPFTEANVDTFKVNSHQEKWRENYVHEEMPYLLRTIDQHGSDNQIGDTSSDTRCITYCRENFDTFLHETQLIHTDKKNVKEIKFSKDIVAEFSAFGTTGNPREKNKYPRRLFVQFQYVDEHRRIVDLKKTYGYSGRKQLPDNPCKGKCRTEKGGGGDNGTLCPPCTNCPPNYPGCSNGGLKGGPKKK
jgi:hypothetical protein